MDFYDSDEEYEQEVAERYAKGKSVFVQQLPEMTAAVLWLAKVQMDHRRRTLCVDKAYEEVFAGLGMSKPRTFTPDDCCLFGTAVALGWQLLPDAWTGYLSVLDTVGEKIPNSGLRTVLAAPGATDALRSIAAAQDFPNNPVLGRMMMQRSARLILARAEAMGLLGSDAQDERPARDRLGGERGAQAEGLPAAQELQVEHRGDDVGGAAASEVQTKSAKKRQRKKRALERKKADEGGGGWFSPALMKTPPTALNLVPVAGKGHGVRATRGIAKGEVLLEEYAVCDDENLHLTTLAQADQALVMALAHRSGSGAPTLADIFATNALPKGRGSPHGGLFIGASRMNHSCANNAIHTYVECPAAPTGGYERIVAARDIQAGEEVCLTYTGIFKAKAARQRELAAKWGFTCGCEACGVGNSTASDDRRMRIAQLEDDIPAMGNQSPKRGVLMVRQLLRLLEAEGICYPQHIHRFSYDAYQMSAAAGDLSGARHWAAQGHQAALEVGGPEWEQTQSLKRYAEAPTSHPCWGMRR